MKSLEELEATWKAAPAAPAKHGRVRTICVRKGGGVHETPDSVEVTLDGGVRGDKWTKSSDPRRGRQLTLMNAAVADMVAHEATPAYDAGDNFFVDLDLSEQALPVGTRLKMGEILIEVTPEPHLGCKKFKARFGEGAMKWVNDPDTRARRLRGINARVLEQGLVRVGDPVDVLDPAVSE